MFVLGVIAYPLGLTLWLSLTDAQVGEDGNFVGLANFRYLVRQVGFHQALINTLAYSAFSTAAKALLGTGMALALARWFPGRHLVYALLFLPLIFPVTMGTVAWYYLFSNVHGAINYALIALGVIRESIPFLGAGNLPMVSLITVNIWHGTALFGVLVLAGLRSVPRELLDAARLDGAGAGQRFLRLFLPRLEPVLALAVLLSLLGTFGDYAIVHLLTNGGPANRTQIVSSFAFATALRDGSLGIGAAMVLVPLPVYVVGLVYLLRRVARA